MAVDEKLLELVERGYLNLTDRDDWGNDAGTEQFEVAMNKLIWLRMNDPATLADTVAVISEGATAMLLSHVLLAIGVNWAKGGDGFG